MQEAWFGEESSNLQNSAGIQPKASNEGMALVAE
jgi:hypothetical protein